MMETEEAVATPAIDESIGRLEHLYRTVTGREAPSGEATYAPIPAEKDPTQHVEKQLDRLLKLLNPIELDRQLGPAWNPPVSVWDNDSEILINVDLPGVARDQVGIVTHGKLLTITGSRRAPDGADFRLRSAECAIGPFRRSILLASITRAVEPKAEMKDGVLEIRIPKEPAQVTTPKAVRVQ
jgi:HSP20 family protein